MVAVERWLSWLSNNTKKGFSFEELVCFMKCRFISSTKLPLVIHSEHAATPNVPGGASMIMNLKWTQGNNIAGGILLPDI
jgi:hypothetical protein